MNKIEKLIEELCPQGVEFRAFQDLLNHKIIYTVSPPKKLAKKHYKSSGEFHSFVFDGPMFKEKIEIFVGDIVHRDDFVFVDVLSKST